MYKPKTRSSDYIQQLADYIKKNSSKGYTTDSLKWALVNQGHSRTEIDRAVSLANEQLASQAPKMVEKPKITIETIPPTEMVKKGFFSRIKRWFG